MTENVDVSFRAQTSNLEAGTQKVRREIASLSPETRALASAFSSLAGVLSSAATAFVALGVAAAAAMAIVAKSATAAGEEARKLADYFDLSNEAIGRMRGVAAAAGVSATDLGKAMEALQKGAGDSDSDTVKAIKAIGLSVEDLKGKNAPELLRILAQRFSEVKDSTNKDAAAKELLGEKWKELLAVLNDGPERFDRIADAAQRAGAQTDDAFKIATKGTSELLTRVSDSASELSQSFGALGNTIYAALKPAIDGVLIVFADLIRNFAAGVQWMTASIKEGGAMALALQGVAIAAQAVVSALAVFIATLQGVLQIAVQVLTQVANLFIGMAKVAIGAFQDIIASATGFFSALVEAAFVAVRSIGQAFSTLGEVISKGIRGDFAAASEAFGRISTDASAAVANIGKAFSDVGGLSNSRKAFGEMQDGMRKDFGDFSTGIVRTATQLQAQLATVWGSGKTGSAGGGANAGEMPDKKDKGGGKANNDATRAALLEIDQEINALQAALQRKIMLYEQDFRSKKITESQKIALVRAATEEEYLAEKALIQKKLELEGLRPQQKQQILNQLAALEEKHRTEQLKLDLQAINASRKQWEGWFTSVTDAFGGHIRGLLAGTESFSQAMKSVLGDLIVQFIQWTLKQGALWLANQVGMTAATVAGATTRAAAEVTITAGAEAGKTAAVAAGAAARTGIEGAALSVSLFETISVAFSKIAAYAGEVIAAVTAWLAPIFGPAALPVALGVGAATVAAGAAMVNSFDTGIGTVPNDMIASIHKGEMIVPQRGGIADEFRGFMSNGGFSGGAGRQPNVSLNVSLNAIDARSGVEFLKASIPDIAKMLKNHTRLNPSVRPA